ncbi:MAG TPA: sulfatase, partial [Thermoanaerobaculia bacterium]|nr:sulfatase [Thermoanaerobaculia bacterium]
LAGWTLLAAAAALPPLRGRTFLRLGAALAAATLGAGIALAPPVRPDILLVTVDTLRADRINAPGFAHLAPNVQRFAKGAVRFTRAWSTAPWTIPSMSSIFTGIHPTGHGARFCSDLSEAAPISRWWFTDGPVRSPNPVFTSMSGAVETLPQALSRGGYLTAGFTDWFFVSSRTGFARGFDVFDFSAHDHDDLVADASVSWLRRARPSSLRPVFLFVHFFGPHQPYEAPRDAPRRSPRADVSLPTGCFDVWHSELNGTLVAQSVMRGEVPLHPAVLGHIAHLYDEEVRTVDRRFASLLAAFDEEAAPGGGALVALTADHGDFLGEKVLLDHGHYVFDPVLRVPLLVRFPRSWNVTPREFTGAVSSHDVYPTLLRAGGVTPRHPLSSEDLRATLAAPEGSGRRLLSENDVHDAMVLLFGDRFAHRFEAVTDGRWKMILTDGRDVELYDLESDPGESVNRAADEPRRVADLRRWLDETRRNEVRHRSAGRPVLRPEEMRNLRSLGYVR